MAAKSSSRWADGRMAAFDTETTGTDVEADRIVSAAVVAVGGEEATEIRAWLVDPGVDVPEAATKVHGITTDQARAHGGAPVHAIEAITAVLAEHLAAGTPLVVFNARYDLTLLDREARRHGITPLVERLPGRHLAPVIDPYVLDKQTDRYRRGSRKLPALADHYRVPHEQQHSAEGDALAAARIAWRIGTTHSEIGGATLPKLHDAQINWAARQAAGLQEYLRRNNPEAVVEPAWPYVAHTLAAVPEEVPE